MDRVTLLFWTLISVLLGMSTFYGISAEQQRLRLSSSHSVTLHNGDLVSLVKVLDGDSLQVARPGEEPVQIRLIGIKAFDAKVEKDAATPFAQAALAEMERIGSAQPLRVQLLPERSQDRHGRWLATLYAGPEDLALHLIQRGLVLVYPVYPFAALPLYFQAQAQARAQRLGFWTSPVVQQRAETLLKHWQTQAE
jgi:endonuclease YncB( thermonuclease family)